MGYTRNHLKFTLLCCVGTVCNNSIRFRTTPSSKCIGMAPVDTCTRCPKVQVKWLLTTIYKIGRTYWKVSNRTLLPPSHDGAGSPWPKVCWALQDAMKKRATLVIRMQQRSYHHHNIIAVYRIIDPVKWCGFIIMQFFVLASPIQRGQLTHGPVFLTHLLNWLIDWAEPVFCTLQRNLCCIFLGGNVSQLLYPFTVDNT